jgi:hypothetical protein
MFNENESIFGGQGFDGTQVQPSEDFSPVPPGDYPVQITGQQTKETKKGDGQFLELEMTILGGQYQGRKVWERLNLVNKNPNAVEIAQRNLSAICHAIGKPRIRHESELVGGQLVVKVIVKDNNNECKGFKAGGGGAAPAAPVRNTPPPQTPPPAQYTPPAQPAAAAAPATGQPAMPWQ